MESVYIKKAGKHKGKKIINFQVLLMSLYILFNYIAQETLIPPVVSSITMYAFVAWTFLSSVILNGSNTKIYRYSVWYVLLMVWSLMSFLWADHAVWIQVYNMTVCLVITFCFMETVNTKEKLDYFAHVYVVSADILCLLVIATGQFSFGQNADRLGSDITGNANIFSSLLMVSSVFASWLLVFKKKTVTKFFNAASLVFLLFMMASSGGRKTIIAVVICLVYFYITKDRDNAIRSAGNILKAATGIALLYFAVMKIPMLYETIGFRFEQLFSLAKGGTSKVSSDSIRKQMIEIGFEAWLKKPVVGYGLDTFKYYNLQVTNHFYYAHNNYIELLYDLGIIGFLLYYCFVGKILANLVKIKSDSDRYKELGIGLIIEALIFDIGGVSYYTITIQIILCFAFICFRLNKKDKQGVAEGTTGIYK